MCNPSLQLFVLVRLHQEETFVPVHRVAVRSDKDPLRFDLRRATLDLSDGVSITRHLVCTVYLGVVVEPIQQVQEGTQVHLVPTVVVHPEDLFPQVAIPPFFRGRIFLVH